MSEPKKPEDEQDPLADLDGDGTADEPSQETEGGGGKGPRGAVGSRGG